MKESSSKARTAGLKERVLDPVSRSSEILFGLIMVLSFTCSISAWEAGREDVREMLLGALGCNLAWGIIDAFFYLMTCAVERGRERLLLERLKNAPDSRSALELLSGAIPKSLRTAFTPSISGDVRVQLAGAKSDETLLGLSDLKAAVAVFTLVFLSTFPVAIPFIVMREPWTAMRVSNLVALILLFALGFSLGHYAGRRPWLWGFVMTVVGVLLVSITIALGG